MRFGGLFWCLAFADPRLDLGVLAGSAASVEHPGPGGVGIFQAGLGYFRRCFSDNLWFAGFHFQPQRSAERHGWCENAFAAIAAIGAVGVAFALINRAPNLIVLAATAAAELVDGHGMKMGRRSGLGFCLRKGGQLLASRSLSTT